MQTIATADIAAAIDATIAARKEQLPAIQAERERVAQQLGELSSLQEQLDGLLSAGADDAVSAEVADAKGALSGLAAELEGYRASLDELEAEFTRDTLNIGVSGAARTGKSTTLQHITGLTDHQIPSGGLNPVTAVRSEIFNSPRNEAVVTFKTERAFVEGYVRPHVANVNEFLGEDAKLAVGSLAALKAAQLPEKLAGAVPAAASDSLKRLHEAKRSAATFEGYLGAAPATVSLDDVSRYVTYPAPGAEQREAMGGPAADRRYLAVELAQVYCQFPNLGAAKVGLVDLPGLGEIGNSASEVHLKGLESKVDQILLVMKPSKEKAFADAEIGCTLDRLQAIQPAVRRGDLIVAGVNKDVAAGQAAADNLVSHFNAEINAGRDDGYQLVSYCAVDDGDVSRMFAYLCDRLGSLLPEMDRQKVAHCMGAANLDGRIAAVAAQVVRSMDRVLRSVPSSDRVMKQRIDAIERSIVGQLNEFAVELDGAAQADSAAFKAFLADAQRIHDEVEARIADGLFRAGEAEWLELTSSSRDYYNLYRDECKRVRYEIIDAYCGLDRFYGEHVSGFKARVLDTVLRSCGMDRFFSFGVSDSADERIERVALELGSTLRDDDLDSALRLLSGVKFDFRSNVFLQIEGCLAQLANPGESFLAGKSSKATWASKREVLGGNGSSSDKQEVLAECLRNDARKANDAVLKALKGEKDHFNKYLAVSIDFFNNYLYGKDEDNFKQVVIRGLIREYKQWVLPDADDASKSPIGRMAREVKESALSLAGGAVPAAAERIAGDAGCGQMPVAAKANPAARAASSVQVAKSAPVTKAVKATSSTPASESASSTQAKKVDAFEVGEVLTGEVTRVDEGCAYVSVRDHYGFVPKGQVSNRWVNDVRDFVKVGERVSVKVIKADRARDSLVLSMKQCG